MLKNFLVFFLAIPLCSRCQSYADSPFYKHIRAVPSTAHVEGWQHGTIKANGIVIDLSEAIPSSSPDFGEIRGWSVYSSVDKNRPPHIFHYFIQYDHLNAAFGYDLLVEPVQGTDEIRCTFSALTDPEIDWHRDKEISLVALPPNLAPLVIKSGDVISIATLPLGPGRIPVVHYLHLIRTDLTTTSIR